MGLDDLPAHRRDALLWRYALQYDYDGVDELVRDGAREKCRIRWGPRTPTGEWAAVRGDDGRHHLVVNGWPRVTARVGVAPAGRSAGGNQRRPTDDVGALLREELCQKAVRYEIADRYDVAAVVAVVATSKPQTSATRSRLR